MMEDDELYVKVFIMFGDCELKNEIVKVLGLNWDIVFDEFFFDFIDLCNYGNFFLVIKCLVFKLIVKIFDLIGFLIFFMIEMKILF